jgi:hypothetical protein
LTIDSRARDLQKRNTGMRSCQIAAAQASHVCVVQVVLKAPTVVEVTDMSTGTADDLEFSDAVVAFALGFGKLLVVTITQAKVFAAGAAFGTAAAAVAVDVGGLLLGASLAPRCFCLLLAGTGPQVCAASCTGLNVAHVQSLHPNWWSAWRNEITDLYLA